MTAITSYWSETQQQANDEERHLSASYWLFVHTGISHGGDVDVR